jgi:AraC family 4-hydroxyphenylacetate 3-monooxygenase operon regulatory protein
MPGRVIFKDINTQIYPDTCKPLKIAASKKALEMRAIGRGSYPGYKINRNDLIGLRSLGFWDAKKEQDFGLTTHRNEGIEFSFCEAGHLSFACEGRKTVMTPNTLSITRPWQPHSIGNPNIEISRLHWLILDVDVRRPHQPWLWPDWIILDSADLDGLTRILRENEIPVWDADEEIGRIFRRITSNLGDYGSAGVSSSLKLLINELLLNVYLMLKDRKPELNDSLVSSERSVDMFLNELPNMLHLEWTSAKMSDYCHLKPTRFIHYCKILTNMSPIQYLNYLRIKQAKGLLDNQALSVTDIAFECGFSSSQYFNRMFKQTTERTPLEYRRSQAPAETISSR